MKNTDRAYLAAVLDCEASIGITRHQQQGENRKRRRAWSVCIEVTNTKEGLVRWLEDRFGGSVAFRERPGNRKPQWAWVVYGRNCAPVLEAALPFLTIKRNHAEIVLEFIETLFLASEGVTPIVTDELVEYRDALQAEISVLNRRGR